MFKGAFEEADGNILEAVRDSEAATGPPRVDNVLRGDGTTALCVCVMEDPATAALSVAAAWAGDSRALLIRGGSGGGLSVVRLTEDHKPGRADERKRIVAAGGMVEKIHETWRACAR